MRSFVYPFGLRAQISELRFQHGRINCRTRIRSSDGVVALVSKNTAKATGQLWEIQCAYDEKKPVMPMWINDERPTVPALLKDKRINVWSWENLKTFINKL